MATRTEVLDAELNRIDAEALDAELTSLAAMHTNGSDFEITIIAAGTGDSFNLTKVLGALRTDDADAIVTTLKTDLDTSIKAAIGATDATAGSIRKALADAVTSYDANITGT